MSAQAGDISLTAPTSFTSVSDTHIDTLSILNKPAIHLGFGLIPHIAHTLASTLPTSAYAIITDTTLAQLFLPDLERALNEAVADLPEGKTKRARVITFAVPPGEQTKSRKGKADIEDWLLRERCTRDTVILALGGGVIGDLVGFVAATFMRGVKFCQIPTTLLAMVDSSVGGKTAIDTPLGKNLIGAFHQPSYIFIDPSFLASLPEREFVNGMAEVIKTAAIWKADDFTVLESSVDSIRSAVLSASPASASSTGRTLATRTPAQKLLLRVILGSIAVKSHIVTLDPHESGLRNLVNFGHTIGHAIEAVLTPQMLHGECVAIGMILEAEVARSLGWLGNEGVARLTRVLRSYGLPVSVTDKRVQACDATKRGELTVDRLLDIMRVDKKNAGSTKKIVLLKRIGECVEERASPVEDDVIARIIAPSVRVVPTRVDSGRKVSMTTPGSKSISNRALVLAAMSAGTCRLKNLLHSDDTQVMMTALEDMEGATFEWEDGGETLVVNGQGGILHPPTGGKEVYLGNAGTASRFLATLCTLASPLSASASSSSASADSLSHTVITGNSRMQERPIGPLVDALLANGSSISYLNRTGSLPLRIPAAGLKGGLIQLSASISSQYVSSILLSAPNAKEEVTLELVGGNVISQPYIDMTTEMMKAFGITVERLKDANGKPRDAYRIPKGVYKAPGVYNIESDASSATYPLAVAAITGSTVTVENIGSASLQGDARFAKDVLEPMGCTVHQTESSTTVTGPPVGQLRALGVVDMEPMTDAFLTASVLAAVASKPSDEKRRESGQTATATKIIGIANQRVKECNRIKAMKDELAKLGVKSEEHEDGIEIQGGSVEDLEGEGKTVVHCYDDHRVAMAFSVLGVVAGLVLDEKRSVEKTWPSWWDDVGRKLGVDLQGVQLPSSSSTRASSSTSTTTRTYPASSSIILIGMRGAGKTYVGGKAALELSWPMIDADVYFESRYHTPVRTFVEKNGWPAFREAELAAVKEMATAHPKEAILSLGGGIVETPEAREFLKAYKADKGPVVWVTRDIDEIEDFLEGGSGEALERPAYGEPVRQVYERRKTWFAECSNYEFVSLGGGSTSAQATSPTILQDEAGEQGELSVAKMLAPIKTSIEEEVARFFKFVAGVDVPTVELSNGGKDATRTSMLCLTWPDIRPALSLLRDVSAGTDALEFRVDLLSPTGEPLKEPAVPPRDYVATQLALVRQQIQSLPIIFTVRTRSQGGMFNDDAESAYWDLLDLGVRSAVEFIDVETRWAPEKIAAFAKAKGDTKIIASWHDFEGKLKWDGEEIEERYSTANQVGDIVKIVTKHLDFKDNFAMVNFRERHAAGKPLMTIGMGTDGQLSRILNPVFTPITHPALPAAAAPGQLSLSAINTALASMGQLPKLDFYIIGTPIQHSQSPTMHNTAFKTLGLPHHYHLHECAAVDESIRQLFSSPAFGGASVTIPHKLAVIPFVDEVTTRAKLIGAVNTIIPRSSSSGVRSLVGDNTDWLGIKEVIQERRTPAHAINSSSTALVIGAGGTCRAAIYALHDVGFRTIYLFNRTPGKAQVVADQFAKEGYNVVVLSSLETFPNEAPAVVVSTVPGEGTATKQSPNAQAGVLIPDSVFSRKDGGILVELAYKPKHTPIMLAAASTPKWTAVPGVHVLLHQGFHQFKLWTGRRAPMPQIEVAVMERYNAS